VSCEIIFIITNHNSKEHIVRINIAFELSFVGECLAAPDECMTINISEFA